MKRGILGLAVGFLVLAGGLRAHEGMDDKDMHMDAKKQALVLKGQILDMACYMNEGAEGEDHASCAAKCVKGGAPMGFLAEDGKLYFLVNDHKKEKPFEAAKKLAGENVVLQANLLEKNGVKALQVEGVQKAGQASAAKAIKAASKKWVCTMDGYESDKPGKCPKCGMDLVEKE